MRKYIKYSITTWLLLFWSSTMLLAASPNEDDFNPSNPPEPNAKFKIEVLTSPYAYCSGSGMYGEGEMAYIYTSSANENYQFSYWMKDGEKYSDQQSFSYVMTDENVVFEAIYDYVPVNPSEPSPMNKYRLYLITDDAANCSFNYTSGEKIEAGTSVWLYAYLSRGYKFKGWYNGEKLISTSESFYYTMPSADVHLTARVEYSPENPSDPSGTGQDDVETSITKIKASDAKSIGVFNLDGTVPSTIQKGQVYIVNHKKVILKR